MSRGLSATAEFLVGLTHYLAGKPTYSNTPTQYAHQVQDFQLEKHQKTFDGRVPPGPDGGASALPDSLAAKMGK